MNLNSYIKKRQVALFAIILFYSLFVYFLIQISLSISTFLWHSWLIKTILISLPTILFIITMFIDLSDNEPLPYMMNIPESYEIYPRFSLLKSRFQEIINRFGVEKEVNLFSYHAPSGESESEYNYSIFSYQDLSGNYVIVPVTFLRKNIETLLGIASHELGHIICSHSKINMFSSSIYLIGLLYSIILSFLLGIFYHSVLLAVLFYFIGNFLTEIGYRLIQRNQEYTADGIAAHLGFAEVLIQDFASAFPKHNDKNLFEKIVRLTKSHPSDISRIKYLIELKKDFI